MFQDAHNDQVIIADLDRCAVIAIEKHIITEGCFNNAGMFRNARAAGFFNPVCLVDFQVQFVGSTLQGVRLFKCQACQCFRLLKKQVTPFLGK